MLWGRPGEGRGLAHSHTTGGGRKTGSRAGVPHALPCLLGSPGLGGVGGQADLTGLGGAGGREGGAGTRSAGPWGAEGQEQEVLPGRPSRRLDGAGPCAGQRGRGPQSWCQALERHPQNRGSAPREGGTSRRELGRGHPGRAGAGWRYKGCREGCGGWSSGPGRAGGSGGGGAVRQRDLGGSWGWGAEDDAQGPRGAGLRGP